MNKQKLLNCQVELMKRGFKEIEAKAFLFDVLSAWQEKEKTGLRCRKCDSGFIYIRSKNKTMVCRNCGAVGSL